MPSNSKTCLVSGGAGFIGSHLVDRLIFDGHSVVVLDNFATGRTENLQHLRDHPKLTVIRTDISVDPIGAFLKGVEWVFHLAALADIVPSIQRPLEYHQANVNGTVAMLEAARAAGVRRFIYAASSSCYGIPDIYPTAETAAIRPQYPYALTKFLGEQCVLHWGQVYRLPVLSLRFFNVYGPRARTSGTYGAVFGVFLSQKLAGQPATIVGDGTQTRDFTFVADVVDAVVKAAESDLSGMVMNVGSGGTYSVNRLVQLLEMDRVHIPKRPGEPDCTLADMSRIRELLGWQPKVPFEDGVKIMLNNINYWHGAPVWTPQAIQNATKEWFIYLKGPEA